MNKHVVCLYEKSGLTAEIWAEKGYNVYCYDIQNDNTTKEFVNGGNQYFIKWNALNSNENDEIIDKHLEKCVFMMGMPPCDDLAVSGAAHFANKEKKNPNYRKEAMELVYIARDVGNRLGCTWVIENPVSVISSEWRKPDHIFHPFEYGGYLPEGDVHPTYPEYIEPRDAYTKKTCYWTSDGFNMPPKKPVDVKPGYSKQHRLLGGKSLKTKNIRSTSPRGIAKAIYVHNSQKMNSSSLKN